MLFRFVQHFFKRRIEVTQHVAPFHLSFFHLVQFFFHLGGEVHIHDGRKIFQHYVGDHIAQFGGIQAFFLPAHIAAGNDRSDGRCIGAGTADALFFQGAYQRGLRVPGGRLGEVLLRVDGGKVHAAAFFQHRQNAFRRFLLVVRAFDIYGAITGKGHMLAVIAQYSSPAAQIGGQGLEDGGLHLAG